MFLQHVAEPDGDDRQVVFQSMFSDRGELGFGAHRVLGDVVEWVWRARKTTTKENLRARKQLHRRKRRFITSDKGWYPHMLGKVRGCRSAAAYGSYQQCVQDGSQILSFVQCYA